MNDQEELEFKRRMQAVSNADIGALLKAERNYGGSWKKRGGIGAFMMLARKWDRLENFLSAPPDAAFLMYDIFAAIAHDQRPEGLIDDIRDLRRYLILVEAEMDARGALPKPLAKDECLPLMQLGKDDECFSKGPPPPPSAPALSCGGGKEEGTAHRQALLVHGEPLLIFKNGERLVLSDWASWRETEARGTAGPVEEKTPPPPDSAKA